MLHIFIPVSFRLCQSNGKESTQQAHVQQAKVMGGRHVQ